MGKPDETERTNSTTDKDSLQFINDSKTISAIDAEKLEDLRSMMAEFEAWMKENEEIISIFYGSKGSKKSEQFYNKLTLKHCQQITDKEFSERFKQIIEKKAVTEEEKALKAMEVLSNFDTYELIDLYKVVEGDKISHRTSKRARGEIDLANVTKSMIVPTFTGYQHSMGMYKNGTAYLRLLSSTDGLVFENGLLSFSNLKNAEAKIKDLEKGTDIEDIDLPLLRIFYSIILKSFQDTKYKKIRDTIRMHVSDLSESMGGRRNLNDAEINNIINKTKSFHNMIGVVRTEVNGRAKKSFYQVLNFESYDAKTNTVAFSSPYMNYIIKTVFDLAIQKDKKGNPKLQKSGEPFRSASHSFLISSDIAKERNKAAVENVVLIVTLIETSGGTSAHIRAKTLIERNTVLKNRLKNSTNKRQILKRTFSKTWELLQSKTRLSETYKNLQISVDDGEESIILLSKLDPENKEYIPTVTRLDNMVFNFLHEGKTVKV